MAHCGWGGEGWMVGIIGLLASHISHRNKQQKNAKKKIRYATLISIVASYILLTIEQLYVTQSASYSLMSLKSLPQTQGCVSLGSSADLCKPVCELVSLA